MRIISKFPMMNSLFELGCSRGSSFVPAMNYFISSHIILFALQEQAIPPLDGFSSLFQLKDQFGSHDMPCCSVLRNISPLPPLSRPRFLLSPFPPCLNPALPLLQTITLIPMLTSNPPYPHHRCKKNPKH